MAISNRERVTKSLEHLREGLHPFVERELKDHLGSNWFDVVSSTVLHGFSKNKDGSIHWDTAALLKAMNDQWARAFKQTLGHAERALVSELITVRNAWAHDNAFSSDDTYRALDSAARLLMAVSAGDQATEVDKLKQDLMRVMYAEKARNVTRYVPTSSSPKAGLSSWRDVIAPHPDVGAGRFAQAEFAANLAEVHEGKGSDAYLDPIAFYQRTYLTAGLRHLLVGALERLSGKGGNPVLQLQTNFGGGKTHSMLALFHLFGSTPSARLPGIEPVLDAAGVQTAPQARRAVLVGTYLSPGHVSHKPDGTQVRTLWGELAWQLGGIEGFALVAESDRTGVSPGAKLLTELFRKCAPCIVLIDEWVAYARQLVGKQDLPAGSFEAQASFAQALTEAAKATPQALVVASIPASDESGRTSSERTMFEVGGEHGLKALHTLEEVFKRIATPWHPATAEEGFEIVRRRLFEPLDSAHAPARDAVLEAFSRMYRDGAAEYPGACIEGAYRRKMEAAYPIHPELFDKLFGDWSSLDKFQKTRGVLRFLAKVVHRLWESQDAGLLIMPSMIPLDDPGVYGELRNYLDDPWEAIVSGEVDGLDSLPLQIDRSTSNLGRYSACRRVTRTVFMGTAPGASGRNPGVDDREVRLGCCQPGESVATFGDALRRLTDRATYLYVDGSRYWFSIHPTVTRIAEDRARALDDEDAVDEVLERLRKFPKTPEFSGVHVTRASGDVPDEPQARLVILHPRTPHARGQQETAAQTAAMEILNTRGNGPRINRNMVVFLAADRSRIDDLFQAAKQFRAWDSIVKDEARLELTTSQRNQAKKRRDDADSTVDIKIRETWTFLLVPHQESPTAPVELDEDRGNGSDAIVARTAAKLMRAGKLLPIFGALPLRLELDKHLWGDRDHVSFGQLFEYFSRYLYLPRLVGRDTLVAAVQDGAGRLTIDDTFAVADAWDEARGRYKGLRAGGTRVVQVTNDTLIVRPSAAAKQSSDESGTSPGIGPDGTMTDTGGRPEAQKPSAPTPRKPTLFVASAQLDPLRIGRDAGRITEEVIQHLSSLAGADVMVTLEVQVRVSDGVEESIVRTVSENCRTLGFKSHGFEE